MSTVFNVIQVLETWFPWFVTKVRGLEQLVAWMAAAFVTNSEFSMMSTLP